MRLTPRPAYLRHKLRSALEMSAICSFHLQPPHGARDRGLIASAQGRYRAPASQKRSLENQRTGQAGVQQHGKLAPSSRKAVIQVPLADVRRLRQARVNTEPGISSVQVWKGRGKGVEGPSVLSLTWTRGFKSKNHGSSQTLSVGKKTN